MKYKVGDVVKIANDFKGNPKTDGRGVMAKWLGKTMTIKSCGRGMHNDYYTMQEDAGNYYWFEDMIVGLVEPDPTNAQILKLAIDTYGQDEQMRMCVEEMAELTVALNKYHREPDKQTCDNVLEEIADVCIMLQQIKMIFGEKVVDEIVDKKTKRLAHLLEDEQEVEVVYGKHSLDGNPFTWINPDKHEIRVGGIAKADTRHGEKPIIVENTNKAKYKYVKHHREITGGVE